MIVLVGAILLSKTWVVGQPAEKPLKIGILDLRNLMDNCQMRKDKEVEINRVKDAEAAKLNEEKKTLDGIKAEIDLMANDDPKKPDRAKDYTRKQDLWVLKNNWLQADVLESLDKALRSVYGDALRMIEEFREKNGYDVILQYDSRPLGGAGVSIRDQLAAKAVMARAASVDVTDAVTKYINEAYEREKKKQ
jgi:Skp family chaperone for outer membrane proteins